MTSDGLPDRIGPFTIVRRVGAGGMAEAFEGVRRGPGRFEQRVCVKRVLPAHAGDGELRRLFLREARLAASLSHRAIVRVIELGEDGGTHFLALELVDGVDLRYLLRALPERRLPVEVAMYVAAQLAEALEHAHGRGVLHRDVSPANVLASADGEVKLIDFGIGRALVESPSTRSEVVRGNVWYMAPEQLEEPPRIDARSDLFSLGMVLYQSLAGRRPSDGATELAALRALADGRRLPLREAAPHVPDVVATVVERLIAQRPRDRVQSAAELADRLAPWAQRGARRSLARLVRSARPAAPQAPARVEEPAVREPPCERPRWARHALGPGVWDSLTRALARRAGRT